MHGPYTHISDYIRNVAMEIASAAARVFRGATSLLATKKIQLTGAVYTQQPVQIGVDKLPITIPVIVDPDKHTHTIATITGGKDSTPDTVVVRDANKKIRSSGTSGVHTGYILANGEDIASLLVRTDQPKIQFVNLDVGRGNVIIDLNLKRKGNTLVLTRTWGTIKEVTH